MRKVMDIYHILYSHFGPQHWWPGGTNFEICIGAILTQNTNWRNVEKAIECLRKEGLLNPEALAAADVSTIERCVRPAGFFKQKSMRIRNFAGHIMEFYGAGGASTVELLGMKRFFDRPLVVLRKEMLSLNGIGKETADSILLYAGEKPVFVVDAYTRRLCQRLPLNAGKNYEEIRRYFESEILGRRHQNPWEIIRIYNEFHALIVALGKNFCRKKPKCKECPLEKKCRKIIA